MARNLWRHILDDVCRKDGNKFQMLEECVQHVASIDPDSSFATRDCIFPLGGQ
jgi:hypothetical protein